MIFRKAILIILVLLNVVIATAQQNKLFSSNGVVGIWQMIDDKADTAKNKWEFTTYFKVFNADSSFYVIHMKLSEKLPLLKNEKTKPKVFIGVYGRYKIISDSTLEEYVTEHSYNPSLTGTTSILKYKFIGNNKLTTWYKTKGYSFSSANKWTEEKWERLSLTNSLVKDKSAATTVVQSIQNNLLYWIIGSLLVLLLTALLFFYFYKTKQKQKIAFQKQQAKESKYKLEAIRSQLNPHFIFNALSGIQNFINKNETQNADKYLSLFSRLTRNVLDNSKKELITIEDETHLLDDYLKMEQMRFGFQYSLTVDNEIDFYNTQIPVMLIQPIVENAVKHGIAHLKEKGEIWIDFVKKENDIVITIKDNGKGFDANKQYVGMGIQLTKNRVALLKDVYPETPASISVQSSASGTFIEINLEKWL